MLFPFFYLYSIQFVHTHYNNTYNEIEIIKLFIRCVCCYIKKNKKKIVIQFVSYEVNSK